MTMQKLSNWSSGGTTAVLLLSVSLGGCNAQKAAPPPVDFEHTQYIKSATSAARADLMACRNLDNRAITAGNDGTSEELLNFLHGTWVGRVTQHGVPIETSTYMYFDTAPGRPQTAMMIDRVNLKPDNATLPAWSTPSADEAQQSLTSKLDVAGILNRKLVGKRIYPNGMASRLDTAWIERIEQGLEPGAEMEQPSVLGAFWTVTTKVVKGGAKTQGHMGVQLMMNGEYHGLNDEFSPGGINFKEGATFFKEGDVWVNIGNWSSPADDYETLSTNNAAKSAKADKTAVGTNATANTVYVQNAVVAAGDAVDTNGALVAGSRKYATLMTQKNGGNAASLPLTRPTLTFVNCQYEFVDTYVKVSSANPTVDGLELKNAFQKLNKEGYFTKLPSATTN